MFGLLNKKTQLIKHKAPPRLPSERGALLYSITMVVMPQENLDIIKNWRKVGIHIAIQKMKISSTSKTFDMSDKGSKRSIRKYVNKMNLRMVIYFLQMPLNSQCSLDPLSKNEFYQFNYLTSRCL